jgi:ceramide glucosyltransferase
MAAAVIATACAGAYLAILLGKAILAMRYAARYPRPQPWSREASSGVDLSAATIVQPILSGDPDLSAALADNLATLPEARFLWLIDDDDEEATRIVSKLRDAHPAHRIETLVCAAAPDGVNPKLFKLELARSEVTRSNAKRSEATRSEAIRSEAIRSEAASCAFVVVDDDTRLTREGLAALLAALGTHTHTVATGLPCYLTDLGRPHRRDLPSRLLAEFVNNNAALTYLPLLAFAEPPTINGMTYAMTPASLDAIGGFTPLLGYLADDLAVARRVIQTGGAIRQTPYPQFVATSVRDLRHYRALMHRWFLFALLLLREQSAGWTLAITLLHGLPPLLLWALLLWTVLPWTALLAAPVSIPSAVPLLLVLPLVLLFVLLLRAATLIAVQRRLTGRSRHSPVLSIVSELLQPLHLLHALVSRRIVWRTRRYLVRANDDFRAV